MPTIRTAAALDQEEWVRLRAALYGGASAEHAAELPALLADPRGVTLVAERETGGLCGFIELFLRNRAESCDSSPVAFVEGWFVDPDRRGEGLGRALMQAGEAWGAAQGCTEMASDSRLGDLAAHRAHAALGFREVERLVAFKKRL